MTTLRTWRSALSTGRNTDETSLPRGLSVRVEGRDQVPADSKLGSLGMGEDEEPVKVLIDTIDVRIGVTFQSGHKIGAR